MNRIIDVCTFPYDRASWQVYFERLVDHAKEYFGMFGTSFAAQFGADPDAYRRVLSTGGPAVATRHLLEHVRPFDLDEYLRGREREGIVAEMALGTQGVANDHVLSLARRAPGRVHAWVGLSLIDAQAALAELKRCLELGATGLFVAPVLDGVDVTHDRFAGIFALAAEHRLGIYLHTGHHFVRSQPLDITTWRHLDVFASRYPALQIIAAHAGWPWVLETLLVAARHENVYLEISGHRPARMKAAGFGWEPMVQLGAQSLRHKILFGTATWLSRQSPRALAGEVVELVGEGVAADWLHDNALRLLHRTERSDL